MGIDVPSAKCLATGDLAKTYIERYSGVLILELKPK